MLLVAGKGNTIADLHLSTGRSSGACRKSRSAGGGSAGRGEASQAVAGRRMAKVRPTLPDL